MKPLNRKDLERIAHQRIRKLFALAEEVFQKEPELADRYVQLARKISSRYRAKLPKDLKKRICKHCNAFLVPGKTVRVRVREGKLVYYCLKCKKFMRFGID